MAAVIFDCLFWLFSFLRMGTIAFTAQALGAGDAEEIRATLLRAGQLPAREAAALEALCESLAMGAAVEA